MYLKDRDSQTVDILYLKIKAVFFIDAITTKIIKKKVINLMGAHFIVFAINISVIFYLCDLFESYT